MATAIMPFDVICNNISCKSINIPAGSVGNAGVAAGANIDASKLVHQITERYQQNATAAVVGDNQYAHVVNGATCTLAYVKGAVDTPATGADRTVSIDLQRSTGGGAFTTALTSPLTFNNASTARTVTSGSIATASLAQGDILKWVVTVAGAAGNQAIGVIAEAFFQETAQ